MTSEWERLSAFNQIRRRTEMYFGSRDAHTQQVLRYHPRLHIAETTWVPAVFTAFRELVDNALDEVITHGHGNRIDVTYDPATMTISVSDNGRGMPIEWSNEHQNYAATVLLSEMNSGRNFADKRGEARGLNGIGAKGVNYCSEWFKVAVTRGKQHFEQNFHEGEELIVEKPIITAVTTRRTGTTVHCKLSATVFADRRLPNDFIADRMTEIALCYPKLYLTYNGEKVTVGNIFGDLIPIICTVDQAEFKAKFYLVPDFLADGEFQFSLVNAIPLFNGGTHLDAFRRGFPTGLLTALERESKRRKLSPNRADIMNGTLIYAILDMAAPSFDSQSKSRLINEQAAVHVRKMLEADDFFSNIIKNNPFWIDAIFARCAERTQAKDNRDVKKQGKKNLRQKVEDLEDACASDRSKCTLMLCEGKSAVAGCAEARDANFFGALPLRGKILNVFNESHKTILENDALSKVMRSIGLVPGERANRYTLRYGRVFFACDADEDGKSIVALLINFFYTCWPELFDKDKAAFFHVFDTPLIIAMKGKQRRYWYNDNYSDFNSEKFKSWEIIRAKGLAALTRDDWRHVLHQPKLIPIIDDGKLKPALDLIFSQQKGAADRRKEWIGI